MHTAVAAVLAVATGLTLTLTSTEAILIAAMAILLILPIAIRLRAGEFYLYEPIVVANAALLVMYVLRPAYLIASSDSTFKGYSISGEVTHALAIAAIAVAGFQIGYSRHWPDRWAANRRRYVDSFNLQMTVVFVGCLAIVATLAFAIFLAQAGGVSALRSLLAGRGEGQDAFYRGSTAYLYSAPLLVWPASMLLFAAGLSLKSQALRTMSVLLMVPVLVYAAAQGSRITLLPLLLTPLVYALIARRRRPALWRVLVIGYLVFTVGLAYFRDTRSAGVAVSRTAELQKAIMQPQYEWRQLVGHGVDNDMFESLAAELDVVPSKLPVQPFQFVVRTLAKPVPSIIWRGKPLAPEEQLAHVMYPQETVRASSSPGLVGNLYLMGGEVGVFGGLFLVGVLFRLPWSNWRVQTDAILPSILLAISLMFVPILLRGAIGDTLARALFGIAPVLVAGRVCLVRRFR